MGQNLTGTLSYGYALGGPYQWEVSEVDDDTMDLTMPWWLALTDDQRDGDGFVECATNHLETAHGKPGFGDEDGYGTPEWHAKVKAAREALKPVELTQCGWGDSNTMGVLLAAFEMDADNGWPAALDFAELAALRAAGDWDAKLNAALQVLGLTPLQARPKWLLTATFG